MKLNAIANLLKEHGYVSKEFKKPKRTEAAINGAPSQYRLLDFPNVFTGSDEKEVYILEEKEEKVFSSEEITQMEKKVANFIFTRPNNDPLKYNINLVLICPFDEEIRKEIVNIERSKYYCRKIFFNSAIKGEDLKIELSILPFIPISKIVKQYEVSSTPDMLKQIKRIIGSDALLEMLCSEDELDINTFVQEMFFICEGE